MREEEAQEVARLKEQLAQKEQRIQELEGQLMGALLRIEELERRLAKDSHNSSLPPSRDHDTRKPLGQRKKSQKRSGGQPGHPGHTASLLCWPDEVIVHRPSVCQRCRKDLSREPGQLVERRQVHDLPAIRGPRAGASGASHLLSAVPAPDGGKLSGGGERTGALWPTGPGTGRLSLAVPVASRPADV